MAENTFTGAQEVVDLDNRHQDYEKYRGMWRKCRLCIEGSQAVKKAGEELLPRLEEQSDANYEKYKTRALFYEATGRTADAMLGLLFSRQPVMDEGTRGLFDVVVTSSPTWEMWLKNLCMELIEVGRAGVLVDYDNQREAPHVALYTAETIIDWHIINPASPTVVRVVLLEDAPQEKRSAESQLEQLQGLAASMESKKQWRVLEIDEEGYYVQRVYKKKYTSVTDMRDAESATSRRNTTTSAQFVLEEEIYPLIGGRKLTMIPFYFFSNNLKKITEVTRPPLMPLVETNINHYMTSADLENGRHYTGLPMLFISGVPDPDVSVSIGAGRAFMSTEPNARAYYVEYSGAGLVTLENALAEKERIMSVLGASMLEMPRRQHESFESQKIKKVGENSILANLADSVNVMMNKVLQFTALWAGNETFIPHLEIQKEYALNVLDPGMIQTLMVAVQSGAISFDTYFYQMQQMGMYRDGTGAEEEAARIAAIVPGLGGGSQGGGGPPSEPVPE